MVSHRLNVNWYYSTIFILYFPIISSTIIVDLPSFRSRNVDVSALSILTRKYPYVYISVESPYIQQKLGISVMHRGQR